MAETIKIELTVDSSGAVSGIASVGGALDDLGQKGDRAAGSGKNLTTSFISAQAAIGAAKFAFDALIGAITSTIQTAASFQSAFTGVEKTLNTGNLSFEETQVLLRDLRDGFEELANTIPVSFEELSKIGEIGGQLGIPAQQLEGFTDVIAKLGVTTELTSEAAATQLARLANVTGGIASASFDRLGSTIVALGNNLQTTEPEILAFAQRIAAVGDIVGLSQDQILAFGAAFTSVGVPIEAGATAVQKSLATISEAIAKGGEDLQGFASVAGVSAQEFARVFRDDAAQGFELFLRGLREQGTDATITLENLGLGSERTVTALLSAANGVETFVDALGIASQAFEENIALNKEAELRFATFESQAQLLSNAFDQLQATVGSFIIENRALGEVVSFIRELVISVTESLKGNRDEYLQLVSKGILIFIESIDVAADVVQFLITIFQGLTLVIGSVIGTLGQLAAGVAEFLSFVGAIDETTAAAFQGFADGLIESTVDLALAAEGTKQGIQGFEESLTGLRDRVVEADKEQQKLESTLERTAVRYPEVAGAAGEAGDAVGGSAVAASEASKEYEKLAEAFGKLSVAQLTQDAANLSRVIESNGGAANLTAAQLDAAGKSIDAFRKNGIELSDTLEEVAKRLEELETQKAIDTLVKDIRDLGGSSKQVDILLKSLAQLGDVSQLGEKQIEALAKEIIDLNIPIEDLDPALKAVIDRLNEIDKSNAVKALEAEFRQLSGVVSMEGRAAFEVIREALESTEDEFGKLSDEAIESAIQKLEELARSDPGLTEEIKDLRDEFDLVRDGAFDFGAAIEDLSNIMQAFGVDANSTLGSLITSFQQLGSAIPAIGSFDKSILGNDALSKAEKFQAAAGGIASGIAGIANATSRGGAGQAAASGALSGAAAGAQVAGPIGAGIGAAAGAIVGFFRGRGRDKLKKEIQQSVGATVSEELAKAIKEGAEKAGRTIEQESLLNLGDIISSEGFDAFEGGIKGASESAIKLLAGIKDGSIPAKEGIAELGEAFSLMAAETLEAGRIADAELLSVVQAAKASGEEVPEIAAFIAESLSQAAGGISAIIGQALEIDGKEFGGGIQVFSKEDAQAQATIFSSVFFATLEEEGLRAAVDALGPAFDEMQKKFADFGDVDFGGVGRFFEIARDPQFGPLLDGVQGLNDALVGISNAGYLTQDSFAAFQQQGQAAFDQLTAAGLTEGEALQQLAPFLQSAIDAAERFGIPIDENTQALIAQAEANGIAFETDPMNRMADALTLIAELLGATDEQLSNLGQTAADAGAAVSENLPPAFEEAGQTIDENLRLPIEEGFGQTIDDIKTGIGGITDEFGTVRDSIVGVGEAAVESSATIQDSFGMAAAGIEEGLGPVSDKIGTEIREVGSETASAIDASFDQTNKAIQDGLGEVAGTFISEVVPAASAAEAATLGIAEAARAAARAAKEIDFPNDIPGGGGGGGERSAAIGFSGLLQSDLAFQAHAGEIINIIPAAEVRNMQARGAEVQSAQEGFGGMSVSIGDINITLPGGGGGAPAGERGTGVSDEAFAQQMGRVVLENIGNVVEDALREVLNEQT